jgi:hypothetical protein
MYFFLFKIELFKIIKKIIQLDFFLVLKFLLYLKEI